MKRSHVSAALVSASLVVAGCARAPAVPGAPPAAAAATRAGPAVRPVVAKSDDGPKLICAMERPTGSNIMRRVCRSQEQVERDREAARRMMIGPRATPAPEF